MAYILDEAMFTRPDLGVTTIETNVGTLILNNPCAYDYYQITEELAKLSDQGKESMFIKAFTTGTILGVSLGKNQTVDPVVLGQLDGVSLQKLIQFTIDMQTAIAPKIDDRLKSLLNDAGINLNDAS